MRYIIPIALSCLLLPPSDGPAAPVGGSVTGKVVVVKSGRRMNPADARDVWVYLKPVARRGKQKFAKQKQTITQQGKTFIPRVRVVPVGSSVGFPNADNEEHNVFSPTEPVFDLGRYARGTTKAREFLDVGEYEIFCDIHSNMAAKVKVVASEWIAEVKGGVFSLPHVPAGTYQLVAWMPDSDEVRETITVTDGGTVTPPPLHLQAGQQAFGVKPHTRKDGSNYSVYQ